MPRSYCIWLTLALLLVGLPGYSQAPEPPKTPPQKVLTVHLTLPTVLGKLGELAGVLPRTSKTSRQTSTDNPVVTLAVPLPRFLSGSDDKPAAPRKP
ncbi:hypothetical protein [Hymenobacter swuensis]|uniref:Uncharacterized protein n=1 Tax=Hymenobacter swuensis DY53 TaxID=1227739 RepID=W8EV12_9BACT|nr:hypothetical protein [Hymenobacter swuensis]AHJ96378.1 hypothetical protein Hsw_0783 [Hymenobacter swuensis DY53]